MRRRRGDRSLRFAQSALPSRAGGTARLAVYVASVKTAGPVSAYLVLGDWQENTVTWNTQPQLAGTPLNTQPISLAMTGGWVEFDVSAAVNAWIKTPASNFGIALVGAASPRT